MVDFDLVSVFSEPLPSIKQGTEMSTHMINQDTHRGESKISSCVLLSQLSSDKT